MYDRCACGNRKRKVARQCSLCYHHPWTEAEDSALRELHGKGLTDREIAELLERSEDAIKSRNGSLGLKRDPSLILKNRKRGRDAFWGDAERVDRWKESMRKQFTDFDRRIRSEEARRAQREGRFSFKGQHHTPETRERIRKAHRGRKTPEKVKQKMRDAALRRWHPELRERFTEPVWCDQCDAMVTPEKANSCQSLYCKAGR